MNTYDGVATSYDVARPDYPSAIYAAIRSFTAMYRPRVLEVGLGTGQATEQMASLDWTVVGIEPGPELIKLARARLKDCPDVLLLESSFEDVELVDDEFDVVAAATAWHWVDPTVAYAKAASLLRSSAT